MDLHTNSGIELIIGPMFAGKTTELIRRLNLYNEMNLKVLYVNSNFDNRSETNISTHNKTLKSDSSINMIKVHRLSDILSDIDEYNVIGIDEGQFFVNLYEDVMHLVDVMNKRVVISGLDSNYKCEPFGDMIKLIPMCDSVVKLSPFCKTCRDEGKIKPAIFTYRHSTGDELIEIGGKDKYYPVCRPCYKRMCPTSCGKIIKISAK